MRIAIRPARPSDHETIVDFNARLAAETEDRALDPATLRAGVGRVLAEPALGRYFIAERAGAVAGQLMITYEWSDWRNGLFWWLQSVYVPAAQRRQGVFRALYRHVETAARAEPGCCGLRLYVDERNQAAQDVYRALGMVPAGYRMLELELRSAH